MRFCTYCGNELGEDVSFCPNCGARVAAEEPRTETVDSTLAETVLDGSDSRLEGRSAGIAVLSFIFPLIGLILWAVWKDTQPGKATSAAKGALASVCFNSPIIGLIIYLTMKESHPELAKAGGVAAIVGVIFSVVISIFSFVIGIVMGIAGDEIGVYYGLASLVGLL